MHCRHACNTHEHFSRRSFLKGATAGALGPLGFAGMTHARAAEELASNQKQAVVFWLSGAVSQLESWDPKPGTPTGGPFQAIPTSVPGIHISELLPHTARQMHHLSLVRGLNTAENNHAKGHYIMHTGRRETPGFDFPFLGSAFSKQLAPPDSPLPGYICIGGGGSSKAAAFLGPRHVPMSLSGGKSLANLVLPKDLSIEADGRRRAFRASLSQQFAQGRRSADTEIYNQSFDQAQALMARKEMFDFSKFLEKDIARYGDSEFAKHCLMARKLVENGVTFTKIQHRNYDSHSENFNFHIEQLGEFDQPFAAFIEDLADRGLMKHTLVIVMCEFGRTPGINSKLGRDHWSKAWSIALGGCGIQPGAVVGKTNENGTEVIDREVNAGHLFHTYYRAVGLDPTQPWVTNGRPIDKADPETEAITELLVS